MYTYIYIYREREILLLLQHLRRSYYYQTRTTRVDNSCCMPARSSKTGRRCVSLSQLLLTNNDSNSNSNDNNSTINSNTNI